MVATLWSRGSGPVKGRRALGGCARDGEQDAMWWRSLAFFLAGGVLGAGFGVASASFCSPMFPAAACRRATHRGRPARADRSPRQVHPRQPERSHPLGQGGVAVPPTRASPCGGPGGARPPGTPAPPSPRTPPRPPRHGPPDLRRPRRPKPPGAPPTPPPRPPPPKPQSTQILRTRSPPPSPHPHRNFPPTLSFHRPGSARLRPPRRRPPGRRRRRPRSAGAPRPPPAESRGAPAG